MDLKQFSSKAALTEWANDQTLQELAVYHDRLAGVKPVNKFESREAAADAIWAARGKGRKTKAPAHTDTHGTIPDPAVEPSLVAAKPTETPTRAQRAARAKKVPAKKAKAARKSAKKTPKKTPKPKASGGRREQLIALLSRKGGAKLTEIQKAFKYLPHSVRGAISILGRDHKIESSKVDGDRVYQIVK
jgi:hypothetical protein